MAKPLVILDSGHAEHVGGKRSPDSSLKEWEFNNDMQRRLEKRLKALGFDVYLTNPNPAGKGEIGLAQRAALANKHWESKGKPNAIFVSLHANAFGVWSTANGVEVFHTKNCSSKSKKYAKIMCDNIHAALKKVRPGSVNRGVKAENFTVIYKAAMPSILIEYAFYTNREDLKVLKNNRAELCEATVKALCESFNIPYQKDKKAAAAPAPAPVSDNNGIATSFLVKIIYKGKEGLNIRKDADINSIIKGQVFEGQVFTIVEVKNGWGRLKSGMGWISMGSKYVKKL